MWYEEYENLSDADKREFTRLVNFLLSHNFILREKFDTKLMGLRINPDYRFIERHFEIFTNYLSIAGWELQKDNNYGVISLYNRFELNRARLKKFDTLALFALRLLYEEEREKLSLRKEVIVTKGDVVKKLLNIGVIDKKPAERDLKDALNFFKNYQIIEKMDNAADDYESKIIIYPTILFIITNEKINSIYNMLGEDFSDEENDLTEEE
ncbi:MAG: DUF4194 domain-containing protein [Thermovenabulum sp.]|uniref:DUF4194 domain-containing protein n=1 Tax=Thermovenabulum sp. TaxID=3100335 RepID=UPI003C7B40ED